MSKNTVVEDVQKMMYDLKKKRAAAIEEIEAKKRDAEKDLVAAQAEMAEAASVTDVDAYDKASEHKRKAQIAVDMYSARCDQIMKQELISGQESDEVINSLQKYIRGLESGFTNDARAAVDAIIVLLDAYFTEVEQTMKVYKEWTLTVRDVQNVPYFPLDYKGCGLANQINESVRLLRGSIDAKQNQMRQKSMLLREAGHLFTK